MKYQVKRSFEYPCDGIEGRICEAHLLKDLKRKLKKFDREDSSERENVEEIV